MDSSRPRRLAIRMLLRTVVLGALVYLLISLLHTQLFATMLIVCCAIALLAADVVQLVYAANRVDVPDLTTITAGVDHLRKIERANTLLDTVAAALLVLDADGRVALVNRAARRLAGAPAHRLQQLASFGPEAARHIEALTPGARRIVQLADGQQVLAIAAQFSTPGESPQRLISLQRVAGELDAVELKAWQDVSRVLAHEMMNSLTPIASLSNSLEALFKDALSRRDGAVEEVAGALDAIKRRSDGLLSFVERYRRVAELPQPQLQTVSVQPLLSGIERLMSATFRDNTVSLRRGPASGVQIQADAALVEQALLNLLRNALDACRGVPEAQVELGCELREAQVFVTVTDNGRGLDDGARSHLFVPFFTTKPGGAGIGLSFARQVALAHGGRLEVRGNEPQGTRFTLILPAGQVAVQGVGSAGGSSAAGSASGAPSVGAAKSSSMNSSSSVSGGGLPS